MTTSEFVSHLVTDGLVSRDQHIVQRVKDLTEQNFSRDAFLAGLSDEELSGLVTERAEAKQKEAEIAAREAESNAKAEAEEKQAKEQADKDAAKANVRQDRLNEVIAAAIAAFNAQDAGAPVESVQQ